MQKTQYNGMGQGLFSMARSVFSECFMGSGGHRPPAVGGRFQVNMMLLTDLKNHFVSYLYIPH